MNRRSRRYPRRRWTAGGAARTVTRRRRVVRSRNRSTTGYGRRSATRRALWGSGRRSTVPKIPNHVYHRFSSREYRQVIVEGGAVQYFPYSDSLFSDTELVSEVTPFTQMYELCRIRSVTIEWFLEDNDAYTVNGNVPRMQYVYDPFSQNQRMTQESLRAQPTMREKFMRPFQRLWLKFVPKFRTVEQSSGGSVGITQYGAEARASWKTVATLTQSPAIFLSVNGYQVCLIGNPGHSVVYRYHIDVEFKKLVCPRVYQNNVVTLPIFPAGS